MRPITYMGQESLTKRRSCGSVCSPPGPESCEGLGTLLRARARVLAVVGKGSMGLWSMGMCLSWEGGCSSQPGTSLFWQERAWGSQAGIRLPSALADGANHAAVARAAISRPSILH